VDVIARRGAKGDPSFGGGNCTAFACGRGRGNQNVGGDAETGLRGRAERDARDRRGCTRENPSAKYQPSATLKTIVGPVAEACPLWAPTALKTALMASRTMDITHGAASVFVSWFGSGVTSYQEQTYGHGQWEQPLSVGTTTPHVWLRVRLRRLTRVINYTRSQITEGAVVVIEPDGTGTLKVPIDS
jgi:hypothetical protein